MTSDEELLRQPIGFWLKRADQLITAHTNRALEAEGLSRFHWQLLNSVFEDGEVTVVALQARLRDFVDAAGFPRLVADLVRKGWLGEEEAARGRLRLSEEGRVAHGRVLRLMEGVRERSLRGIAREDYVMVVRTLQRLCANLEAASSGEDRP